MKTSRPSVCTARLAYSLSFASFAASCFGKVAEGPPHEIVTAGLVRDVFGMECQVIPDPETGTPLIVPASRARRREGARRATLATTT